MAVDKLIDSTQLDAALTATANAIRAKTGTSVSLPWNLSTGFQTAVGEIPTGSTDVEDSIMNGTISQYQNDRVTTIKSYTFVGCYYLKSVNFPICQTIGSNAFASCYDLKTANFPSCLCVNWSAFYACTSLENINFPVCKTIGSTAFANCSKLTSVYFPSCKSIENSAFCNCNSLQTASFPMCASIYSYVFMSCYRLISLYLLGSYIPYLQRTNAFYSTPIEGYSASAGQYGSIYVPASRLSDYQTATNWVYFSSRFVGLTAEEVEALEETA